MNTANKRRTNAAIVGVLFIIGTATGISAAVLSSPILDAPDYLSKIAANEGTIRSAAVLAFLMGIACAGIGLGLYPIMRKYSVGLAIGVVGFRVIEGMCDMLGGLSFIALLAVSREFVNAGAPDGAYFQTIGAIINAASAWINNGAVLICWCIGAFMYYGLFYRYRLVPRWISVWGLIGITLTTIASVLVMVGVIPGFGTIQLLANLPIMPQEMVFAAWLIVKGVNLSAAPSRSAQLATGELLSAS
ncbi:MAG: DUF4386 domain-containing protein [Chloroflexales bacterium]